MPAGIWQGAVGDFFHVIVDISWKQMVVIDPLNSVGKARANSVDFQ